MPNVSIYEYNISDSGSSSNNLITLEIKQSKNKLDENEVGEAFSVTTDKSNSPAQELSSLLLEARGE